jgi:hypothetical protein
MRHGYAVVGAFLLALALMLGSSPAGAQPRLIQLSCDTLTTTPYPLRIEFAISNDDSYPICAMYMTGGPDGAAVYCYATPADWICDGYFEVVFSSQTHCIAPGETYGPFAITTDRFRGIRFLIDYRTSLAGPPFSAEFFFPNCDPAVPTQVGTWGRIKASYR